ncbi:MAG: hypothetical protein HY906_18920 [Deltaproteobacteria bacterium]|nr:hypothetical protein [Deltaproteobacteria bacterium]
MKQLTPVAAVFAFLVAACGAPASNQPPPGTPPAGPGASATPARPPAPPAAAPLTDPRAESYGGTVGSLDEIKWLVATSRSAIHAHQAGYAEQVHGIVLRRGAAGLEWASFFARGAFKVTKDGVIVGSMQIAQGTGPDGKPHAHWTKGPDAVTKFQPIPAAKLAALRAIVERTPLPIQPTKTLPMGPSVEISTTTRHLQGDFGRSLVSPYLPLRSPDDPPAAKPSSDAPSTDLADMAIRIESLMRAPAP